MYRWQLMPFCLRAGKNAGNHATGHTYPISTSTVNQNEALPSRPKYTVTIKLTGKTYLGYYQQCSLPDVVEILQTSENEGIDG
jgi:hypothetical protein